MMEGPLEYLGGRGEGDATFNDDRASARSSTDRGPAREGGSGASGFAAWYASTSHRTMSFKPEKS